MSDPLSLSLSLSLSLCLVSGDRLITCHSRISEGKVRKEVEKSEVVSRKRVRMLYRRSFLHLRLRKERERSVSREAVDQMLSRAR